MVKSNCKSVREARENKKGRAYHVPHRVPLKTKLLREVKENVLNLLARHGYLTVSRPRGVMF
jgi:hypothetical protein